jgi:hypothetical protein
LANVRTGAAPGFSCEATAESPHVFVPFLITFVSGSVRRTVAQTRLAVAGNGPVEVEAGSFTDLPFTRVPVAGSGGVTCVGLAVPPPTFPPDAALGGGTCTGCGAGRNPALGFAGVNLAACGAPGPDDCVAHTRATATLAAMAGTTANAIFVRRMPAPKINNPGVKIT